MKKTLAILLALVIAVGIFGAVGVIAYAKESDVLPPELEGSELPEGDYELHDYKTLSKEAREAYKKLKKADKMSDASENFEEILAGMNSEAEEEDTAIRNIFEFHLYENTETYAKLMDLEENARFVTIPFKCTLKGNQFLMCMEYVDDEWITLPTDRFTWADGFGTVKVHEDSIIALIVVSLEEEEEPQEVTVIMPSVGQKAIPEAAGDFVIRLYIDESGPQDVIWLVPDDEYEFYECSELMGESYEAYDALATAEKISDVCSNFVETIKALDPSLSEENAVIRDVFEFRLGKGSDSYNELLENKEEERRFCDLPFSYKTDKGQYLVVLEYLDGEWVALDDNHCVYDGNTASVRVEYDGLIAICVVNK